MALSLSCFLFHWMQRSLKRTASSGSSYRPELIARVHAAIASSPEAFTHDSKSSAVAGVAANQTVDAKARAASVHRRIDVIRMVPGYSHSWFLVANTRQTVRTQRRRENRAADHPLSSLPILAPVA